jgi:hypothetical protein
MKRDYRKASPEFRVRADAFSEKLILWSVALAIAFIALVLVNDIFWREDPYTGAPRRGTPNGPKENGTSTPGRYNPYAGDNDKKDPYADSYVSPQRRQL